MPLSRPLLIAAIPLFWVVAFNLGPMVSMIRTSFMDAYPPPPGEGVSWTLDQYRLLLLTPTYLVPLARTFLLCMGAALLLAVTTFPLAWLLAREVNGQRRFGYMLILLLPFWAGEVLRIFSIVITLGNRGLINAILLNLGIIERPVRLLYGYFSLATGFVHLSALYMFMPLYAALERLPESQLNAARDLGAGAVTRFFTIVLPQVREGLAVGITLVFLINAGSYSVPAMLGGPDTGTFAETIASFFHSASSRWATGAAASVILLVVTGAVAGSIMLLVGGHRRGQAK